jgi:hypothetical protein
MKKLFLMLLVAASSGASAQTNCPFVNVTGPESVPKGEKVTFTVAITGGDAKAKPSYVWTSSDGKIVGGQGTTSMILDTKPITAPGTITATVDVGGYPKECITSSSYTIYLVKPEKKKVAKAEKK